MKHRGASLALLLAVAACGKKAPPPAQGPTQVGVVTLKEEPVTLTTELPGRISAFETSEVRPQVNGVILKRLFREGEEVRAGTPLYQIDPAPYQASAANARAALAKAKASIASSQALARRYGELVKINAIAKQDFENAQTTAEQAVADVSAQQAMLHTAQIDLDRTRVRAPITGRIGRSMVTPGALVSASQTDAMTTIQRLDLVYVDLTQSSAEILKLRKQMLDGALAKDGATAKVQLKLEDGSTYPIDGTLQFADVTVDAQTGSQTIRATFPNPQRLLLPGMYARAVIVEGRKERALLVPQVAVSRDEKGNPVVMLVGAGDKVEQRKIVANRTQGTNWVVTDGVKPGDRVIVDGAMMVRPGAQVKPVAPGQATPPPGGQAGGQQNQGSK